MPIYLLERTAAADQYEHKAKIIRAKSVKEARNIANDNCWVEGRIWNSLTKVKCMQIKVTGKSKEILGDVQ